MDILAPLYKCTGKDIALLPGLALALVAASVLNTLLFNLGNYLVTRKIPCFTDYYN